MGISQKLFYSFIVFFLILLFIPQLSCSTVEPPDSTNDNDTTSQNFSFEILEFGDGFSSSYFNDVWIFNENDIWVCGNVFTNDSTDGNLYHWNGNFWKAHRLNFVDMEGIWGLDTIMYLASGGVWKFDRDTLIRQNIQGTFSQGQAVHKLWGSAEDNIYGVGPDGTIVWYNGVQWTKIEFDTQWYFFDVTGVNQSGIAYAVARRDLGISAIIKIDKLSAEIIYEDSSIGFTSSVFNSITTINSDELWISGYDIWSYKISSRLLTKVNDLQAGYFIASISSFGRNDIYGFGGGLNNNSVFIHYNGKRFTEFHMRTAFDLIFGGSHSMKDIAVSVGQINNKGYVDIIKRN